MKLGLRAQLFLASVLMILVSMVSADVYLTGAVDDFITQRIRDDLHSRLLLSGAIADASQAELTDEVQWQALAHSLGELADARASIIRLDGTLIGDSGLDLEGLKKAENHKDRDEVRAAFSGGIGASARLSVTKQERMIYLAQPLHRGGRIVGAVRLALSLTEVDALRGKVHDMLAWATAIALLVAIALSSAASTWAAGRARSLASAAGRMAGGDLSTRTNPVGDDEFAELGRALDRLATSLSSTLHELRSERDLLGGILASMQEGVMLVDKDDRVVIVNPALREMLLLGADTVGSRVDSIVADPELVAVLSRGRTNSRQAVGEIELAGLKPRKLLVRALTMTDDPGRLLAVFVDVTELRRLEKLRKDFVANVSHELRTPVTAIRSATETLQDAARNDPKAVPMFVDIIARNAERMRVLVEDLLDLSKIESREYRIDPEPIDLTNAVPQTFALFRDRADKKRITLAADIGGGVPPVRADRRALEQVLTNLLENSIKYCPEGSTIRVRAEEAKEGRFVRIAVEDSGPGIEAKHLPRLFERFYRVDKGRARDVGGTGLGLSIVKHLVEAMGGEVGVQSEVGKGSTFWVLLPRAPAVAQAELPMAAAAPPAIAVDS